MSRSCLAWVESLLVGILVFGVLGTAGTLLGIMGLVLLIRDEWMSLSDFDPTVVACAAGSAAIAGVVSWRLLMASPDARPWRGALAGVLVGVLAHPLCWAVASTIPMVRDPAMRGGSIGDMAFGIAFMTLFTSVSSLGLTGWITVPLGGFLGYCTRRIEQFRTSRAKPRPSAPGDVFLGA